MHPELRIFLRDAAAATPDPDRARKNLDSFCETNPGERERLREHIRPVSLLFSISQFLANFAVANPEALFDAVNALNTPLDEPMIRDSLRRGIEGVSQPSLETLMNIVRVFKKRVLLRIVLRDVLGRTEIIEGMSELSLLADIVVQESLKVVRSHMKSLYGEPEQDVFSVIAVGKLGSEELNFSSDIDLLYVYGTEQGETSGIVTPQGTLKNRISNHEYYCRLGETLNRFLSANTENGIGYRVDLRLRPEGQRGSLAISLSGYEIYYESWGRAWERAVLLRARPVAGDVTLGRDFLEMSRPFVYRKYLDFNAIDEIRRMKTKIDEKFKKDDIKRGYGGIREIEFFSHALQLIYGGKEPLLRERSTLKGLHHLLQKNLIGEGDYSILSDSYGFLRKLEHRLQQLNDLQTHSLPSVENDLVALSKKMGYADKKSFLSELEDRRRMVRRIYDSLFAKGPAQIPRGDERTLLLLSGEFSDAELGEFLKGYPMKDPGRVIRNIRHIRESTHSFQTLRGQRLLSEILPLFLEEALKSVNPDAAVNHLESFVTILASEESYLDLFTLERRLIPILIHVFSQSDYLARNIMKRREYLELLGNEMFARKTLLTLKRDLRGIIGSGRSTAESIRIFRQMEELRLGILFLDKKIDGIRLIKELSKVAEAIVSVCVEELSGTGGLAVIAFGKSGGRELTFNSDLDLIFVSGSDVTDDHVKTAERLIRLLLSYTQDGTAYSVDTRLRPEGSRGPLVSSIIAFRDYYGKTAHFWEFQALLKARPLAGDRAAACHFMEMKKEILEKKGRDVSVKDIKAMRERIQRELSREAGGYDIKLGVGGLEELEFAVQYLQLVNACTHDGLLVQGTLDAIKRLGTAGVLDKETADSLRGVYIFYRTLESFMRLTGEGLLKEGSVTAALASEFAGFDSIDAFLERLKSARSGIHDIFNTLG